MNCGEINTEMEPSVSEALLRRIEAFSLDDPGAKFPLSARLAKENRWTPEFCFRAIREYKRFAALSVLAGHQVSPSHVVDQVWHLHLLYTESYWRDFCGQVLLKPLNHYPSRGGSDESTKFGDMYTRTLASYETIFGEEAPSDIWPSPYQKRVDSADYRSIDIAKHWVIARPRLNRNQRRGLLAIVSILLAGCAGISSGQTPLDWKGPDFLQFFMVLYSVLYIAAWFARYQLRMSSGGTGTNIPNLSAVEVGYLVGRDISVVNTAVVELVAMGAIRIDRSTKQIEVLDGD